jgi:hypothetical protein
MTVEVAQVTKWVDLRAKHPSEAKRWFGVSQHKGSTITVTRQGKPLICLIELVQVGDYILNEHSGESYEVREVEIVHR